MFSLRFRPGEKNEMIMRERERESDTVKEMLSEGVVRHELGHEQSLAALAAAADQIGEAGAAELADGASLLLRAPH